MVESVSKDLIPFSGFLSALVSIFRPRRDHPLPDGVGSTCRTHIKHIPLVAGGGENVPLEIARALTCWLSVLEERGSVYGMEPLYHFWSLILIFRHDRYYTRWDILLPFII